MKRSEKCPLPGLRTSAFFFHRDHGSPPPRLPLRNQKVISLPPQSCFPCLSSVRSTDFRHRRFLFPPIRPLSFRSHQYLDSFFSPIGAIVGYVDGLWKRMQSCRSPPAQVVFNRLSFLFSGLSSVSIDSRSIVRMLSKVIDFSTLSAYGPTSFFGVRQCFFLKQTSPIFSFFCGQI